MRRETSLGIGPLLGLHALEAGELASALDEARDLPVVQVAPDHERTRQLLADVPRNRVRGKRRGGLDRGGDGLDRVGDGGDGLGPVPALEALGAHDYRNRRSVVRENGPVARDDASARPRRLHPARGLARSVLEVLRGVHELYLRKSEAEHDESDDERRARRERGEVAYEPDVVTHPHPPFSTRRT